MIQSPENFQIRMKTELIVRYRIVVSFGEGVGNVIGLRPEGDAGLTNVLLPHLGDSYLGSLSLSQVIKLCPFGGRTFFKAQDLKYEFLREYLL
jgi:hypothetical protein